MYICICNNVTEKDIREAVDAGARTMDCLSESLAVSTCCGQCACAADECLKLALLDQNGNEVSGVRLAV